MRIYLLASALLCLASPPALAGNVMMQIECGNPPVLQETPHVARVVGLNPIETEMRVGGWVMPVKGEIEELYVDEHKVTLKEKGIQRGFVDTRDFGVVVLLMQEAAPGYILVVLPEQLDKLPPLEAGKTGP